NAAASRETGINGKLTVRQAMIIMVCLTVFST
ncbi:MAG: hypothetical protein ACI8R9_002211, partial [Paraglaciecola sp.]